MTFSTAPKTKSTTVLKLAKAGFTQKLLEAVRKERESNTAEGQSKDGKITVKRVGAVKPQ